MSGVFDEALAFCLDHEAPSRQARELLWCRVLQQADEVLTEHDCTPTPDPTAAKLREALCAMTALAGAERGAHQLESESLGESLGAASSAYAALQLRVEASEAASSALQQQLYCTSQIANNNSSPSARYPTQSAAKFEARLLQLLTLLKHQVQSVAAIEALHQFAESVTEMGRRCCSHEQTIRDLLEEITYLKQLGAGPSATRIADSPMSAQQLATRHTKATATGQMNDQPLGSDSCSSASGSPMQQTAGSPTHLRSPRDLSHQNALQQTVTAAEDPRDGRSVAMPQQHEAHEHAHMQLQVCEKANVQAQEVWDEISEQRSLERFEEQIAEHGAAVAQMQRLHAAECEGLRTQLEASYEELEQQHAAQSQATERQSVQKLALAENEIVFTKAAAASKEALCLGLQAKLRQTDSKLAASNARVEALEHSLQGNQQQLLVAQSEAVRYKLHLVALRREFQLVTDDRAPNDGLATLRDLGACSAQLACWKDAHLEVCDLIGAVEQQLLQQRLKQQLSEACAAGSKALLQALEDSRDSAPICGSCVCMSLNCVSLKERVAVLEDALLSTGDAHASSSQQQSDLSRVPHIRANNEALDAALNAVTSTAAQDHSCQLAAVSAARKSLAADVTDLCKQLHEATVHRLKMSARAAVTAARSRAAEAGNKELTAALLRSMDAQRELQNQLETLRIKIAQTEAMAAIPLTAADGEEPAVMLAQVSVALDQQKAATRVLELELSDALDDAGMWRSHTEEYGLLFVPQASLEASSTMCRMLEDGLTEAVAQGFEPPIEMQQLPALRAAAAVARAEAAAASAELQTLRLERMSCAAANKESVAEDICEQLVDVQPKFQVVSDQFTLLCGEDSVVKASLLTENFPAIAELLGLVRCDDWNSRLHGVLQFLSQRERQGPSTMTFGQFEKIICQSFEIFHSKDIAGGLMLDGVSIHSQGYVEEKPASEKVASVPELQLQICHLQRQADLSAEEVKRLNAQLSEAQRELIMANANCEYEVEIATNSLERLAEAQAALHQKTDELDHIAARGVHPSGCTAAEMQRELRLVLDRQTSSCLESMTLWAAGEPLCWRDMGTLHGGDVCGIFETFRLDQQEVTSARWHSFVKNLSDLRGAAVARSFLWHLEVNARNIPKVDGMVPQLDGTAVFGALVEHCDSSDSVVELDLVLMAHGGDAHGLLATLQPDSDRCVTRDEWERWLVSLEEQQGADVVRHLLASMHAVLNPANCHQSAVQKLASELRQAQSTNQFLRSANQLLHKSQQHLEASQRMSPAAAQEPPASAPMPSAARSPSSPQSLRWSASGKTAWRLQGGLPVGDAMSAEQARRVHPHQLDDSRHHSGVSEHSVDEEATQVGFESLAQDIDIALSESRRYCNSRLLEDTNHGYVHLRSRSNHELMAGTE